MFDICYDLHGSPPTYDMVSFLCLAECERIARDEDGIRIVIMPGPVEGFRRDKLWPYGGSAKREALDNIGIPLCRLLPSVVEIDDRAHRDPHEPVFGIGRKLYGFREQVRACRAGVRPLRSAPVEKEPNLVTITLRDALHWPMRNSNVPEWIAAARQLRDRLHLNVVFVPETLKADEQIADFETDTEAARSIPARAALYARAALNLFVSNGPAWLCMAMDAPALIFRPATEGSMGVFSASYLQQCGVLPSGQLPGSPPWQRLVWADDRADIIVAEVARCFEGATP